MVFNGCVCVCVCLHVVIGHPPHSITCQPLWRAGSPVSLAADGRERWRPLSSQPLCIWTETQTKGALKQRAMNERVVN